MKNIGLLIKEQRLKRNISQNDLAEKLGITPSFLSKMENGQKPISLIRLMEIGDILELDFFDQIEQSDELYMKWKEVINLFEKKGITPDLILNFVTVMEKLGN